MRAHNGEAVHRDFAVEQGGSPPCRPKAICPAETVCPAVNDVLPLDIHLFSPSPLLSFSAQEEK